MKYFYSERVQRYTTEIVAVCKVFKGADDVQVQDVKRAFVKQLESEGIKYDVLFTEEHNDSMGCPSKYFVAKLCKCVCDADVVEADMPWNVRKWVK